MNAMGTWGYRALESDCGLDVTDELKDYAKNKTAFKLNEVIRDLGQDGQRLYGKAFETFDYIDQFYDNTAIALTELYFMFQDSGAFKGKYENFTNGYTLTPEYYDVDYEMHNIKSFMADKDSLKFLLRYLTDIRDEVPDKDGERDYVELIRTSHHIGYFESWQKHLHHLISRLEEEIETL